MSTDSIALGVPPSQIFVRVVTGAGTIGLVAKAALDLSESGFTTTVMLGTQRGATTTVIQYRTLADRHGLAAQREDGDLESR